jgi:hypothetical protein
LLWSSCLKSRVDLTRYSICQVSTL